MLNLLLGGLAGAVFAVTATLAAVRNPTVQERLGLVRSDAVRVAERATDPACAPPQVGPPVAPGAVGRPDQLFNRQRLWSIQP